MLQRTVFFYEVRQEMYALSALFSKNSDGAIIDMGIEFIFFEKNIFDTLS